MSSSDGYYKCVCKNCGGHIEFPSEGAGRTVPCPHCNASAVLTADISYVPAAKRIFRVFLAVVVLAAGAGVYWYLIKARPGPVTNQAANADSPMPKPAAPVVVVPVAPPADPWHGLTVGPITLEKSDDGRLVYAVGKLRNASERERFGVKVMLDVFDAGSQKVGTATDYMPSMDPGKEWKFKALVTDRTAVTAQLTTIKED